MTIRLTPAMTTALRAGKSPIVPLIQIDLPGYTLRHLVGSGEVMKDGQKFVGMDPTFGVLVSAGDIEDGAADEAPDWELTFAPTGTVAASSLTAANVQGSPVTGWLGVADRATGLLVPEPIQFFVGELDVARLKVGKGTRTIEWRCASAMESFHDEETGARLSDAFHKLVWPGETGLANMSGIEKTDYWGVEGGPPGVDYSGAGGGSANFTPGWNGTYWQ